MGSRLYIERSELRSSLIESFKIENDKQILENPFGLTNNVHTHSLDSHMTLISHLCIIFSKHFHLFSVFFVEKEKPKYK